MQVFKTEQLKCCSFDASSHSKWFIMAHLERIWSQHFGALECHITTWLGRCKSSKRSIWNVAVLMPLPCQSGLSRLIYLESAFWGVGVSYCSLIRQMQVFKKSTSGVLQFWCLSPVRVAYHGSFRENLGSAFWGFGLSYHNLIKHMQVFKKGTSGVLQFWCLSPVRVAYHGSFRENLESLFRGLGLSYVISQLDETHASLRNGAFEMLQFWCLSPVIVAYHGSFRGNLKSAFWGLGLSTLLCWGRWKLQLCCD